jgi:hypothetical protein
MSRALVAGRRVILQLLATGAAMRTNMGNPTRSAEVRAMVETGHVRWRGHVSFMTADPDQGGGKLDAVAGSEFVDDRIRLLE